MFKSSRFLHNRGNTFERLIIYKLSYMKKLVLLASFVFVLGLVSVNAQDAKKVVKKEAVKTEQPAKKKGLKATNQVKETPAVKTTPKTVKK